MIEIESTPTAVKVMPFRFVGDVETFVYDLDSNLISPSRHPTYDVLVWELKNGRYIVISVSTFGDWYELGFSCLDVYPKPSPGSIFRTHSIPIHTAWSKTKDEVQKVIAEELPKVIMRCRQLPVIVCDNTCYETYPYLV